MHVKIYVHVIKIYETNNNYFYWKLLVFIENY